MLRQSLDLAALVVASGSRFFLNPSQGRLEMLGLQTATSVLHNFPNLFQVHIHKSGELIDRRFLSFHAVDLKKINE
ncbi:hypothetical protein SDC9_207630 [bioreactor metagenome]|uniref:Uncharacterized protein n=1 Tax=bioreactor metagenome TaxID=1076179 RepID=A0A645J8A7_9ZZZZ